MRNNSDGKLEQDVNTALALVNQLVIKYFFQKLNTNIE